MRQPPVDPISLSCVQALPAHSLARTEGSSDDPFALMVQSEAGSSGPAAAQQAAQPAAIAEEQVEQWVEEHPPPPQQQPEHTSTAAQPLKAAPVAPVAPAAPMAAADFATDDFADFSTAPPPAPAVPLAPQVADPFAASGPPVLLATGLAGLGVAAAAAPMQQQAAAAKAEDAGPAAGAAAEAAAVVERASTDWSDDDFAEFSEAEAVPMPVAAVQAAVEPPASPAATDGHDEMAEYQRALPAQSSAEALAARLPDLSFLALTSISDIRSAGA